jgi:hypothetical protein
MSSSVEAQLDSAVHEALSPEPLVDADLGEEVDGGLLDQAGALAMLDVIAAARLQDLVVDSVQIKHPGRAEARPVLHRGSRRGSAWFR